MLYNLNMIGRTTSSPRISGKLGFVHVFMDGVYQQLSSNISLSTWEDFKSLNQGDIIKFEGEEFFTRTNENTIRLSNLEILKKCELGLPDKITGVNTGTARQNRYLNLISEIVSKDRNLDYRNSLILRAKVLKFIRIFLDENDFLEVTTPTLIENIFGCDAKPFKTENYYLRIAPELELKKLVVGGLSKIYEIGKSFRNEGLSQKHNPEFTMLEFYGSGNVSTALNYTKELLSFIINSCNLPKTLQGICWDNFEINEDNAFIEEDLINPTFVTNFTAEESPLAKASLSGKAERFELYVGGMELANGYSEQDDWRLQEKAFEKQGVIDEDYINALKIGLPPTFGVGIGIDRLIMALTGRNIKEVL